jgi:hypothetical protein
MMNEMKFSTTRATGVQGVEETLRTIEEVLEEADWTPGDLVEDLYTLLRYLVPSEPIRYIDALHVKAGVAAFLKGDPEDAS